MARSMTRILGYSLLATCLALSACHGGDGSSTPAITPPPSNQKLIWDSGNWNDTTWA